MDDLPFFKKKMLFHLTMHYCVCEMVGHTDKDAAVPGSLIIHYMFPIMIAFHLLIYSWHLQGFTSLVKFHSPGLLPELQWNEFIHPGNCHGASSRGTLLLERNMHVHVACLTSRDLRFRFDGAWL